uniref:Protein phosphatase methylesterase 1 n=1 Tax=Strombidium rassoulzadegani TaxID=1082188 RepID=A0A7S3CPL0_9SPIT|mmetsp:Transcript_2739/g.4682  ORF Transcript_2739/g.4682 Transcript_2739/m.4682 type:complete len:302 (+) Transcript_2739:374-1279(+)
MIPAYYAGTQGHVFLCLHGAGHSALSFAALAKLMKQEPYNSTVVSFDFRGHGSHFCENESDMSQQTLIGETIKVLKHVISKFPTQSLILVGHSMGGSIATKTIEFITTHHKDEGWIDHIKGLFIIDVVEGSAMDALPFMESIVSSRPSKFPDVQSVVKYGVSSGTVRNVDSAKVSMPAQVIKKADASGKELWVWRTDLLASKQYWTQWFKDLTKTFLGLRIPKQLLLAGNDRMDKELTIAHMQGKFKMVVIDNVGHVIQEDRPQEVASVFKQFLDKFHIPSLHKDQMVITTISGKKVVINQ